MTFLDADVLTAAALNALDNRTVPAFDTWSARDAAIPAPTTGRVCVVAGSIQVYSGSGWQPLATQMFVRKTADQSVTSSTTLVNDSQLVVPLGVGTWRVQALIRASGDVAGDIKTAWTFDGAASSVDRSVMGPGPSSTDLANATFRGGAGSMTWATTVPSGLVSGSYALIQEDHHIVVTTAGNLRLQWAQNTSSSASTIVSAGSRIYVERLAQ